MTQDLTYAERVAPTVIAVLVLAMIAVLSTWNAGLVHDVIAVVGPVFSGGAIQPGQTPEGH